MEWLFTEFVKPLGLAAILVSASVWLIREITRQLLSKDLEKFKSDLQKEALIHRIKYERLYTERAGVIKDLHKKIADTHIKFASYISPLQMVGEPSLKDKERAAVQSFNHLSEFHTKHSIFIDDDMDKQVSDLIGKFKDCFTTRQNAESRENSQTDTEDWLKSWNQLKDEMPAMTVKLKNLFREELNI